MLLRVTADTFCDPDHMRIALITDAPDRDARRVWIVFPRTHEPPIEVERKYHDDVFRAMRVDPREFE